MKNPEGVNMEIGGLDKNASENVKNDPVGVFLEKVLEDDLNGDGKEKIDISYLSPAQKAESMWALFQELKGQISGRKSESADGKERAVLRKGKLMKGLLLLKSFYEDTETKELFLSENARHLKEDAEINGNYGKYQNLKKRLEDTDNAVTASLKTIFKERGGQTSEFDLLLLESNRRSLDEISAEIQSLVDEDPKLGALSEYEVLKSYSEQLRKEKFIWSQSRLEALERIENAAISGKPVLISGESGTGKTRLVEQVALKLTGKPNSQTPGKDVRFEKIIAKPDLLPSSEDGTPYYKYAELGMAVTGKSSTLQEKPENDGLILADDEFNLRPSAEQTEMMSRIASWTPGKKIRMPVTNEEEVVAPNFTLCAMVNLASERYERRKIPSEVNRKFAKVDLDYNEQTPENPEIYEMMLSALMDENGRIRVAKSELSPNYEFKETKDTVTLDNGQKNSRNVKVRELQDWNEVEVKKGSKTEKVNQPVGGFLWKFANVLNQLNLSFSHKETVLKHKKEGQYSKDLIIDIGTVLGWMNEYTKVRGNDGLEKFVFDRIHEEFLDTNAYSSEDKQLLKNLFRYYGINPDKKPEEYEKVDFEVLTPNDIGLLSPRVKYLEVLREDPNITEGQFVNPEGDIIEYLIKPFENGGQRIIPGKIVKNKKGKLMEFMGVSKDNGDPIFRPHVKNKRQEENKKPEANNVDVEEIKQGNEAFLIQTFEGWYDKQKAQVEQKPIIVNPVNQDYSALKSDINPAKFGEYTVNPETQNLDLEHAKPFFLPEAEQQALVGKQLHEVADYLIKTYGNTHYIPGIEYWKYILENPDKAPEQLKDGNYYFNFGSLVRFSSGHWSVPYAIRYGSGWARNANWLVSTWDSRCRVVLLEK